MMTNITKATRDFEARKPDLLHRYSEQRRKAADTARRYGAIPAALAVDSLAVVRADMASEPKRTLNTYHSPFHHIRSATRFTHYISAMADSATASAGKVAWFEREKDFPARLDLYKEESSRSRHTGYYADDCGDEVYKPAVWIMRTGKRWYLIPGYQSDNGFCLDIGDMTRIAREDDEGNLPEDDKAFPMADDVASDILMDAHGMAERAAENEREWCEAWHKGMDAGYKMAGVNHELALSKDYLRRVYEELRSSDVARFLPHAVFAAVMRPIVAREVEMYISKGISEKIEAIRDEMPSERNQSDLANHWREAYREGLAHGA